MQENVIKMEAILVDIQLRELDIAPHPDPETPETLRKLIAQELTKY
jgi:hypothetical protein